MRIRKKQNVLPVGRRTLGVMDGSMLWGSRRGHRMRRQQHPCVVFPLVVILILLGGRLLITNYTRAPQLQLLLQLPYVVNYNGETSTLLNIPSTLEETTTTPSTHDHDHNIVIKWDNWTDIERVVDKMWGGNLFCQTVRERVDRYYNESNAMIATTTTTGTFALRRHHNNIIPIPNVYVHFEFSCYDLYKYSRHGTGNYIQAIYFMRLAVKYMPNVHLKLNITCTENESPELYTNYVLPWFTGVWYTPTSTVSRIMDHIRLLVHTRRIRSYQRAMEYDNFCGTFHVVPTAILYRQMQDDVRRMAIALVGTQPFMNDADMSDISRRRPLTKEIEKFLYDHIYETPSIFDGFIHDRNNHRNITLKPGTQQGRINSRTTNIVPLIQLQPPDPSRHIVFDDAVVHFRCGDLLTTDLLAYGFLTFHGYSRHISSSVRSIGILTQPFGKRSNSTNTIVVSSSTIGGEGSQQQTSVSDQERSHDNSNDTIPRRCRILVYAFQEHLQEKFPHAQVNIRNDRTETVALAYARMVMAKQVIGSMSTFSIYPVIGTFGTGYYLRPKKNDPSFWASNNIYPVAKISNTRTVMFDESTKLLGTQTRDLWDGYGDDAVLQWFRTGIVPINFTVIVKK